MDDAIEESAAVGGISLGTYNTSAEFKDLQITQGGKAVYTADFAGGLPGWSTEQSGNWDCTGWGAKAEQRCSRDIHLTHGLGVDELYDLSESAKARRGGGLYDFHATNGGPTHVWQWNLGGWGNRQHGIQSVLGVQESIMQRVPGTIETGRWYDVRIELKGSRVSGYLDGKLIQEVDVPVARQTGFFASATRDQRAGEIILKLVNADSKKRDISISLSGMQKVEGQLRETVLAHDNPGAANTFEQPAEVSPRKSIREIQKPEFQQSIPANAFPGTAHTGEVNKWARRLTHTSESKRRSRQSFDPTVGRRLRC